MTTPLKRVYAVELDGRLWSTEDRTGVGSWVCTDSRDLAEHLARHSADARVVAFDLVPVNEEREAAITARVDAAARVFDDLEERAASRAGEGN